MIHRFRKVDKDIYRGSAPTAQDVEHLKNQFGIRKIISLDAEAGERIDRACKLLDIDHVKLYIETKKDIGKLLKHNLKDLLVKGGPTFFHCHHGKDRTGLLAALYKVKYMGMSPEKAIAEAKSLGFGLGVPHNVVSLYEHMILASKPEHDNNSADIVSNEREYIGDNRDTYLDEARQDSFAPYLDHTKQAPADSMYNYIMDQSPTRQNYQQYKAIKEHPEEEDQIPQVGVYNNDAGVHGFGPAENVGYFIYD
jgi:protein tyrosine/serine phosphatase